MATYYVRTDGNDSNTGLGPATNQAWQTITKAIGATGIAPGDTLYIAPGVYRGTFTAGFSNPTSEAQRIIISGDPAVTQFSGISEGNVIITNYTSDSSAPSSATTLSITKDYITFTNIRIQGFNASANGSDIIFSGQKWIVNKCVFESMYQFGSNTQPTLAISTPQSNPGLTVSNCFIRGNLAVGGSGSYTDHTDMNIRIYSNTIINTKGSIGYGVSSYQTDGFQGGIRVYNNLIIASNGWENRFGNMSTVYKCQIYNNIIYAYSTGIANHSVSTIEENYNYIQATTARANCNAGANTIVNGRPVLDYDYNRLVGSSILPTFAPSSTSIVRNAGTNSLASSVDMFNVYWLNATTPTIGGIEHSSVSGSSTYLPTERNSSSITIPVSSTSQSIELYLGVTGLTHQSSGLQAYYVRNRSAPVQISLVSQTSTGAWASGGFAEISSGTMPGLYRLDVPDAAFASGSSDVTITVRGASGTNGAVLTVNLTPVNINMSQSVPTSNTAQTVGDALNAARAYGFGKWVINGTNLSLYASDNTTIIKTFTLDSGSYPTSRT